MVFKSNIKLKLALNDPNLDSEQLEKLTINLLREMKELDVERADLVAVEDIPEGSKAFGGFLLGMLQAEVSIANAKQVFGFLGDRLGNKPIELEVEANGKKLKVKASSQQELLAAIQAAEKFIASA
jgi:hypothetical protein